MRMSLPNISPVFDIIAIVLTGVIVVIGGLAIYKTADRFILFFKDECGRKRRII